MLVETLLRYLAILILLIIIVLIFNLLHLVEEQKKQRQKPTQRNSSVPLELKNKLLVRLQGDEATAERLVDFARSTPGKPETWYWEKAIDDLDRDRR